MRWDAQFRETAGERAERWQQTRKRRIAEGKCWQCATPLDACTCPNVRHLREGSLAPKGGETRSGSTAKPQEPGPEGTRPETGPASEPVSGPREQT